VEALRGCAPAGGCRSCLLRFAIVRQLKPVRPKLGFAESVVRAFLRSKGAATGPTSWRALTSVNARLGSPVLTREVLQCALSKGLHANLSLVMRGKWLVRPLGSEAPRAPIRLYSPNSFTNIPLSCIVFARTARVKNRRSGSCWTLAVTKHGPADGRVTRSWLRSEEMCMKAQGSRRQDGAHWPAASFGSCTGSGQRLND